LRLGALLSTAWILSANFLDGQTPTGYKEINGQFQPTNWFHVIFQSRPFDWRFPAHGSGGTDIGLVGSSRPSAAYLPAEGVVRWAFRAQDDCRSACWAAALLLPLQLYVGEQPGGPTSSAVYQPGQGNRPLKAIFDNGNTGWNLIVIPNQAKAAR